MKALVWIDMILGLWFLLLFITSFIQRTNKYPKIWQGYTQWGWQMAYGCISLVMIFLSIAGFYKYYL